MKNIITIITTLAIILTAPVNVSAQMVNNTYKSASGKSMWSVSITGTFTYNGSSAKCVSCSHSSKTYTTNWTIKSISSSKKDNSATANVVAVHTVNGSNSIKRYVTITCSKNGTIS